MSRSLRDPEPATDRPVDLDIDGRAVRLTHPDRVVWPASGTTKRDLVDYLLAVAPVLLPHLRRRAVMLWRFPEGIDGPGWFQAQCRGRPGWVATHAITGRRGDRLEYCLVEEPATLAWLANLGTIELHPHGWTIDAPDEPTGVVFDLDPGPPAGHPAAAAVALRIRDRLAADGLACVVKTSGALGLHVVAPLASGAAFSDAKGYARRVAESLEDETPDLVIARSDRAARAGRVYVDWIQNDRSRQLVAPYSPRAMPVPQVSTPLRWDEVEAAADGRPVRLRPGFGEVLERIERFGDLWSAPATGRLPDGAVSAPRVPTR
ncbi:MAG TPA: non-homologous end-joining DNA ligase [Candidatus Limnocylindrales bacterium]|nr:non-homologous end-joining DNA ligase [Candidatus Limnocylindrales bacterium]